MATEERVEVDPVMRITPVTSPSAIALPVIGNADAADEADAAVDHENLAMRPVVHREVEEPKDLQLHFGAAEQIHGAGLEPYFQPKDTITLIEWFDRASGLVPASDRLIVVQISAPASGHENERTIAYEDPRT